MKSERLIRALIRLYPAEFRFRYSAALLEFHRERMRDGISWWAWPRIVVDHVYSAAVERLGQNPWHKQHATNAALSTGTQDVRYAIRALARRPAFTFAVLAIIALGVGANTAIFSVVHAVLLRPLPYPHAERVVSFGHQSPIWLSSQPEYLDYKNGLRAFEDLSAYTEAEGNLATEEEPERVAVASVTRNFFRVMGVGPLMGREFAADEDLTNTSGVVVISHALWQRRFAGDPVVIGKSVLLNGRPRTVIGVMPPNFDYPTARTDVWLPLRRIVPDGQYHRADHSLFLVGRLHPGVALEGAQSEALTFARRMQKDNATFYDPKYPPIPVIKQVNENLVGSTRPYLWALLGAVGFVLLIVCANIANLLLARGEGRRKEMAVRSALGASRLRLLRQVLAEALLLAVVGGAAGVALAWALDRVLLAAAPGSLPRLDEIGLNWLVLAYALTTSLLAGLMFGMVPALRAGREGPAETLKQSGRSEHQGSSRRMRRSLVIAEVAIAVVLLTGAGMLLQSLVNLQSTNLGFDTRSTLTAKVSLTANTYDEAKAVLFFDQLLERVRALPGVQHAGAAGWLPVVQAGGLWGLLPEGQTYDRVSQGPMAVPQQATAGYIHGIGIPLIAGRDFNQHDGMSGPHVAIVSQAMAAQLWPNQNALGKRFHLGNNNTLMTVVGIVGDIRARGFTDTPEPTMYFPYAQTSVSAYFQPRSMSLVVRTKGDPLLLGAEIRAIVRSLDANVPVSDIRTLEQVVETSTAQRRFSTWLIGAFAALALLLAGIGIFGVISYGVSERRYEIGVRMALGAERAQALALVAGDSLRMAGAGIMLGLLGALVVARAIRSLLVGVPAVDVRTLLAVCALLVVVVLAATVLPARRAMAVDPTDALR